MTFSLLLLKLKTDMCLIDAEDYSDLPVRQYEEDNVLRELNKAFIGFQQVKFNSIKLMKRFPRKQKKDSRL